MSVTDVLFSTVFGSIMIGMSFVVGFFAGSWFSNRWIDHRWYCGRRHHANHPCMPKPDHVQSWIEAEKRLDRAQELQEEARRLRDMH